MSEKRKPEIAIVAKKQGKKTIRVELFRARLWNEKFCRGELDRYRIRVNRKWTNGDKAYTVSEVMRQLRSWIVS